ncbi:MAG: SocA family protein [Proteobacteria bacterium]|nr:SocA family protein [Pseudomonadota bacterium]MBU4287296.1 SocA family protein [Pseudomonadota bacterium]MCG2756915.1 SocA family protein [Desulfobacteraceae bacterium]
MSIDPKQLVKYVVWLAGQFDAAVTETRLIKYLYLIDLYHARIKQGETLTGWPWAFVDFGPYCKEAYDAMEQAVKLNLIEENYYDSKYEDRDKFRLLSIEKDEQDEEPPIAKDLHIYIISQLQQIIRQYGDDTARLLDSVYYDTEPMRYALPKQQLDFSIAKMPEILPTIKMKKISPETLKKGTGIMDKLKKKFRDAAKDSLKRNKLRLKCGLYDDAYNRALEYLDEEDLETGLKGVAKLEL